MPLSVLWRDRAGRFTPVKAAVLVVTVYPAALIALRWAFGDLGGRPITEVIHVTGDWAVRLLLLTLAVTPARAVFNWPTVLLVRRMLGVSVACYASAHLLLYCADQGWNLGTVTSEIMLRFYLTIGFVTLLGLIALAVTSTDGWQRRLRRNWGRLHKLVYPLAAMALFHYFLQSKADVTLPVTFAGFFAWLMLWRAAPKRLQAKPWLILALAPAAAILTMAVEYAWYALATRIPPLRVLWANSSLAVGLRPAHWVLLLGVTIFFGTIMRQRQRKPMLRESRRAVS